MPTVVMIPMAAEARRRNSMSASPLRLSPVRGDPTPRSVDPGADGAPGSFERA